MSRLVSQGKHIVKHFRFVVHQNVGLTIKASGAERTALFARVGVAITPAASEPLL